MTQHLLLAVLIVFCCTVGLVLSSYHANVWSVLVFTIAALVSLQIAYIAGLLIEAFSS